VHLQYYVGDFNTGYDITNSGVFFEMLCRRSGQLSITHVNGVFVNTITVNNTLYTVDPNIIRSWYNLNGHPL
jgi:ribulose 1,5-bisphosphate synthetase/thiazole synthase